eukprot:2701892-Prymnesium_polylepis.1
MVGDVLQMIVHKKPDGGLSAVGGNSIYTYFKPGAPEYAELEQKFCKEDIPKIMVCLGLAGEPLPLLCARRLRSNASK